MRDEQKLYFLHQNTGKTVANELSLGHQMLEIKLMFQYKTTHLVHKLLQIKPLWCHYDP